MATLFGKVRVGLYYVFLIRYAVLVGLFLPGFIVLARWVNPELLGNLLVLETPAQLFHVAWLSLLVAAFVLVASRVIRVNAQDRFADYKTAIAQLWPPPPQPAQSRPGPTTWRVRWLLLLLMGLPLPFACVAAIDADPSPDWKMWLEWSTLLSPWILGSAIVVAGSFFALFLLGALTFLQQLLLPPEVVSPGLLPFEDVWFFTKLHNFRLGWLYPVGDRLAWALGFLGPGYTQRITNPLNQITYRKLAPGHGQVLLWLGATLVVYLGNYVLVYNTESVPEEKSWFAALFFALLLLLLAGSLLTGLSFLLDYTRIPVSLVVVGLSLGLNALVNADHFYEIEPSPKPNSPIADLGLIDTFQKRTFPSVVPSSGPQAKKKTLVVVTAAGGGIQASAWTTQVLSGLDEVYGEDFTRSIGVISATSGGSVGTMYYLANGKWSAPGSPFDDKARREMREMSRSSNLEAAAWGIAHPDLMRVFTPFLVPKYADRGWAIEEVWRKELSKLGGDWQNGDFRLRDWINTIRTGQMPVPIFNATLVESGQRLLISPVLSRSGSSNATEAREFFDLYTNVESNPRVTTAVRLSAAFPYVSPVSRPYRKTANDDDYHVADGGYADNEGAVVAIEWIYMLLKYYRQAENKKKRPFDRILIVRIVPFPIEDKANPADTHKGWLYEILGPLTTIEEVRTASQAERNSLALELFNDATLQDVGDRIRKGREQGEELLSEAKSRRLKANLHRNKLQASPKGATNERSLQAMMDAAGREGEQLEQKGMELLKSIAGETEITWTEFVFQWGDKKGIPLSWKLTASQKANIESAWNDLLSRRNSTPKPPIPNGLNESPFQTLDRFFKQK